MYEIRQRFVLKTDKELYNIIRHISTVWIEMVQKKLKLTNSLGYCLNENLDMCTDSLSVVLTQNMGPGLGAYKYGSPK